MIPFPTLRRGLKSLSSRQIRVEENPKIVYFSGRWDDSARDVVRQAWPHVQTKSSAPSTDTSATFESYKQALMEVEVEARDIYYSSLEDPLPGKEDFIRTMVEHGCFILQVALCSLGGRKALDYPENDRNFGERWDKDRIRNWVTSIFSIRRQLPLVVLQKLMKQSFFVKVIKSKEWKRPKDLPRMTLYDFLVAPVLEENARGSHGKILKGTFRFIYGRGNLQKKPPTLLHALWMLLTGPENAQIGEIKNDEDDNGDENSSWFTVRSATELQKAGITFKNNHGLGIRGIQFKKGMLNAVLYLPSISIEPNSTKSLFENLIRYEEDMKSDSEDQNLKRQEVAGYLQFMKELIRSSTDVKLLATHGIIHADPKQEDELRGMLEGLRIPEVGNNHNLGMVRQQIRGYVKPSGWKLVTQLLSATVFLTLLQTIYTVLGYHKGK